MATPPDAGHLSLWCRIHLEKGLDHHPCSGTCDSSHGTGRLCGRPCGCPAEAGTPVPAPPRDAAVTFAIPVRRRDPAEARALMIAGGIPGDMADEILAGG